MPKLLNTRVGEEINALLNCGFESSDSRITGRLEVYACKCIDSRDKKLLHAISSQFQQYQSDQIIVQEIIQQRRQRSASQVSAEDRFQLTESKSETVANASATADTLPPHADSVNQKYLMDGRLGKMSTDQTQKMLLYLIGTLNSAFPDYDFSSVKPQHFIKLSPKSVASELQKIFFNYGGEVLAQKMTAKIWIALDQLVGPNALAWLPTSDLSSPPSPAGQENESNAMDEDEEKVPSLGSPKKNPMSPRQRRQNNSSMRVGRSKSRGRSESESEEHHHSAANPRQRTRKHSKVEIPPLEIWDEHMDIYAYQPDESTGAGVPYDDEEEGLSNLWAHHYFFFNRKFKRVTFLNLRATGVEIQPEESERGWEEETVSTPTGSQPRSADYGSQPVSPTPQPATEIITSAGFYIPAFSESRQ